MAEKVPPSPGLALDGQAAPTIVEPAKKLTLYKKPAVATRVMSLKERAEALKKRKKPKFRHMVHLTEDEEDQFISLCEKRIVDPAVLATNLFRDGLRNALGKPKLANGLLDEEGIDVGSVGEQVPVAFDRFGEAYRLSQRQAESDELAAKKALVKQLGVQTT